MLAPAVLVRPAVHDALVVVLVKFTATSTLPPVPVLGLGSRRLPTPALNAPPTVGGETAAAVNPFCGLPIAMSLAVMVVQLSAVLVTNAVPFQYRVWIGIGIEINCDPLAFCSCKRP